MNDIPAADIVAELRDYSDLHAAMRHAADDLQVSRVVCDELSGLPAGQSAKVLAAEPMARLSFNSVGWLLPVLGLRLLIVKDHEAIERLKDRRPKRKAENASNAQPLGVPVWERVGELRRDQCRRAGKIRMRQLSEPARAEFARKGGKARAAAMTDWRRRESARAAGLASGRARRERATALARSNSNAETRAAA
jgi:hypothetical protein